jgi:hypothetical protein
MTKSAKKRQPNEPQEVTDALPHPYTTASSNTYPPPKLYYLRGAHPRNLLASSRVQPFTMIDEFLPRRAPHEDLWWCVVLAESVCGSVVLDG